MAVLYDDAAGDDAVDAADVDLHVAGLQTIAADLDLRVLARNPVQLALAHDADVARAVGALAADLAESAGRAVGVARRDARSDQDDLALVFVLEHRVALRIHHDDLGRALVHLADRNRCVAHLRRDDAGADVAGRLGRTVGVDDRDVREALMQRLRGRAVQCLAHQIDDLQRRHQLGVEVLALQTVLRDRRGHHDGVRIDGLEVAEQRAVILLELLLGHDQRMSVGQRIVDIHHRVVDGQHGHVEHARRRHGERERRVHPVDKVVQVVARRLDAARAAGRTGGEDHIRELAAVDGLRKLHRLFRRILGQLLDVLLRDLVGSGESASDGTQNHVRARCVGDIHQTVVRQTGADRNIGDARAQARDECDQHHAFLVSVYQYALGLARNQFLRQIFTPLVQFPVRHGLALGTAGNLRFRMCENRRNVHNSYSSSNSIV